MNPVYRDVSMNINPKVGYAGLSGAITVIVVWVANYFYKVDVPPDVASAFTTICMVITGYFVPSSSSVEKGS